MEEITDNHLKDERKKKKSKKKSKSKSKERDDENANTDVPSSSSTYLSSPFTSLKDLRKHKLHSLEDDSPVREKKRHKKHKEKYDKHSDNASGLRQGWTQVINSKTEGDFATKATDVDRHKKNKNDAQAISEDGSRNHELVDALHEHARKEKHKKKKKKKKTDDNDTHEITLDMLHNSSANSISELADKIASAANANNPALRGFAKAPLNVPFKSPKPSKHKSSSDLKSEQNVPNNCAAQQLNMPQVKSKKMKKPTGKRKPDPADGALDILSKLQVLDDEEDQADQLNSVNCDSVNVQDLSALQVDLPSNKVENKKTSKLGKSKKPVSKTKTSSSKSDLDRLDGAGLDADELDSPEQWGSSSLDDPTVQSWLNSLVDDMVEEELDFDPPELHKRVPSLRGAKSTEKEQLKNEGITIRLGKWSPKEDKQIRENLQNFVKKYNVPAPHLVLGINKVAKEKMNSKLVRFLQLKKFSFHLAKDLPSRTLFSTYLRARKIFHPMDKSKLTKEELSMMFRFQAKVGNKWNTISEMMDKPGAVLREAARYHTEKRDTGEWTAEENERLFEAVKEKLVLREDGSCRKLPWKKIAKKVGTRNKGQCCKQWLCNLCWKFSHGDKIKPKWTDEDSFRLIEHLYQLDAETEADLDWDAIFNKFSKPPSVPAKKNAKQDGSQG